MEQDDNTSPLDIRQAAEALAAKHGPRAKQAPVVEEDESEDQDAPAGADQDTADEEQDEESETEDGEEAEDEGQAKPAATIADDVIVKVKVNGEEKELPLSEVRKGYMMGADYTRKTQEVAEARRQLHAQAQQYEAGIKQRVDEVGFLAQTFMQQLTEAEGSVNWNELRQTNPAEYAARQHDIQQRKALLGRAWNAYQQSQAQQQAVQQWQQQQTIAEQQEKLISLVPEWLDNSVADKEKGKLASYLVKFGVPEQDVNNMTNAWQVALARKAMLFDELRNGKQQAGKQKLKSVPKFTGVGNVDPAAHKSKRQKLIERAQKSGDIKDFAAALAAKYG